MLTFFASVRIRRASNKRVVDPQGMCNSIQGKWKVIEVNSTTKLGETHDQKN
jgi:hypothetical protein